MCHCSQEQSRQLYRLATQAALDVVSGIRTIKQYGWELEREVSKT